VIKQKKIYLTKMNMIIFPKKEFLNTAFQHFKNEYFKAVSANQPKPLKVTKSGCSCKNSLPAPFWGHSTILDKNDTAFLLTIKTNFFYSFYVQKCIPTKISSSSSHCYGTV